jgi:hypothetical protein
MGGTGSPIQSTNCTKVTSNASGCTTQSLPQWECLATEILRRLPRIGYELIETFEKEGGIVQHSRKT